MALVYITPFLLTSRHEGKMHGEILIQAYMPGLKFSSNLHLQNETGQKQGGHPGKKLPGVRFAPCRMALNKDSLCNGLSRLNTQSGDTVPEICFENKDLRNSSLEKFPRDHRLISPMYRGWGIPIWSACTTYQQENQVKRSISLIS